MLYVGLTYQVGNDDCPYFGPKAVAEFASLSGCSTSNIDARFCSNFSVAEECLGDELMTRLNRTSKNLLSSITAANLEDIGYEVDYTNLDNYTSDNINATCRCTQRRSLDTVHDTTQPSFVYEPHHNRQLSSHAYQKATKYGKMKLAEMKERYEHAKAMHGGEYEESRDGLKFVGDQAMTVTLMENGEIYSFAVHA